MLKVWSLVLSLIAIAILTVYMILPSIPDFNNVPFLDQMLQTFLCQDGTIRREQHASRSSRSNGYSAQIFCITESGETEVTFWWILQGMACFLPLVGLSGLLWRVRVTRQDTVQKYDDLGASSTDWLSSMASASPPPSATLAQKLQQLEDAKRQGLLTEVEYQEARRKVLGDAG